MCTHITENTHMYEGISACLHFEAAMPELPVCYLIPFSKSVLPPTSERPLALAGNAHIGTHKATCTNTIYMPDAMFSHLSKHTYLGTWRQHCSVPALISQTVLLHLHSSSSWVVYYIQKTRGRFRFWIFALLNYCWSIASFLIFFSPHFSYCSLQNYVWQQEGSHWRPF